MNNDQPSIVKDLCELLPADAVVTDPVLLESYRHDNSPFDTSALPTAVVLPRSTSEVATVVRAASLRGVPVVTRGAGSGLAGGASSTAGCVVLSTRRLDEVLEIDPTDRIARVQPGVITGDLRSRVQQHGLFYPPDPGSVDFSTIGGNVATNAGGMCCVKYGVTGDHVLGLEAVLADGRVLHTGHRSRKGVAGYDLTRLIVGSEGTLAVITEVMLALQPLPPPASTLVATFDTLKAAARAVSNVFGTGITPSMLEIMDSLTLAAVDDYAHMQLGSPTAMLLMQSDSPAAPDDVALLERACLSAGADSTAVSDTATDAELLLAARRLALPALERKGSWLLDDVAVPPSQIIEFIEAIRDLSARSGLPIAVFGHVGDGNLHPTILYDAADPASVGRVEPTFDAVVSAALKCGGTITGEHGVGTLKSRWLAKELGDVSVDLHHRIKAAFDPQGILNPQKMLVAGPAPV